MQGLLSKLPPHWISAAGYDTPRNLNNYSTYLETRIKAFRELKHDPVRVQAETNRDIRASEKRFYQKIRDIYATAVDYDSKSEAAQLFFKKVQNKMLWAITSHTAPELIAGRADPALPNMGLTTWAGGRVRKQDVTIAKNYLSQDEIEALDTYIEVLWSNSQIPLMT